MIRNDISLSCSDISLSVNDISLSGSDISLGKNDLSLSDSDISLGEDDISLGANDESRRTRQNIATAKTIGSRYLGRYILSREISFKYHRYIAIIAIFDDYRLHYFCTVLYASNLTNPINKVFVTLIYLQNSTFLKLKIVVDTD